MALEPESRRDIRRGGIASRGGTQMIPVREALRRIRVIAHEEYRAAFESRWLFLFSAFFALIVLGLSYFGLAQSREVGFQGFARVTLSLLNLALFVVPLTALLLGVTSITGSSETLSLLLAQPVGRAEVLAGKFLGLGI